MSKNHSENATGPLQVEHLLKENEKLRQMLYYKSEEVNRLKEAFLSNVSHEIRTPMNAIMGFSSLLNDPEITHDEICIFVEGIHSSSKNLLNLIEKIIESAKIESGNIKIQKDLVVIDDLITELKYRFEKETGQFAGSRAIDLRFIKNDKKKLKILTDRNKLETILINLIENAIKFTKNGTIQCGFRMLHNNKIQFYVKDSGIGIPNDKLETIFESFSQIEENHRKKYNGLGIGLSISRKLAKKMGGNISVESSLGEGSVFYLTLPCEVVEFNYPTVIGEIYDNNVFRTSDKNVLVNKNYPTREQKAQEHSLISRVTKSRA